MANYERDARSDEVRVFDGAEDEEDVEGSRLPLLIVIALLVLAAFGAVVWLAYQRGVAQGHSEVPRLIAAEPGPAKVAPTNAGGTPTPYTGLKIYQQPAPSDEDANADTAPPTPAPPTPTTPTQTTPVKPAAMAAAPVTKPAETALATPPAKPAAKPAAVVSKPEQVPTAVVPATKPPVAIVKPPVEAPAALPSATPALAGGGFAQIGSYKSEADANAAWASYKAKHAGIVAGMSISLMQVDLGAKGTWVRLRLVTAKGEAATLCEKLKADGGACIPAK